MLTQTQLDFDAPRIRHSPTSCQAAESIEPIAGTLRWKVLEAIRNAVDGLTDEEGIEATDMNPSTYRPRRIELQTARLIVDSGATRETKSGRKAVVWLTSGVVE